MRNWLLSLRLADLSRSQRIILALIFAIHLGFSLFFVFSIPSFGGPDEIAHYAYVKQLVVDHQLPVISGPVDTRDRRTGAIAHPPLAYTLGTPVYVLTHPFGEYAAQHALRLICTLWAVGTLLVLLTILRQYFADQPELSLAALAFAALLPHFLLLSSVWNSDGLLILLSSVFVWRFLAVKDEKPFKPAWLGLGVLWGILLLTKSTSMSYIVPVVLVLVWQAVRGQRDLKSALTCLLAFIVPGVILSAGWFIHFHSMTGRLQPVPELNYQNVLLKSPLDLIFDPNAPLLVGRFFAGAMRSVWGQVDWTFSPPQRDAMNQTLDFPTAFWGPTLNSQPGLFLLTLNIYRVAVIITGFSFIGLIMGTVKKRIEGPMRTLSIFFLLLYSALGYFTLYRHPGFFEGGRYLLPVITATAPLWVWGLSFCLPKNAHKWLAPALMAFFVVWDIGCAVNLTQVLVPLYAPK